MISRLLLKGWKDRVLYTFPDELVMAARSVGVVSAQQLALTDLTYPLSENTTFFAGMTGSLSAVRERLALVLAVTNSVDLSTTETVVDEVFIGFTTTSAWTFFNSSHYVRVDFETNSNNPCTWNSIDDPMPTGLLTLSPPIDQLRICFAIGPGATPLGCAESVNGTAVIDVRRLRLGLSSKYYITIATGDPALTPYFSKPLLAGTLPHCVHS